MTDDLDGTEADQTVTFSLGPIEYEIDLSAENADKLREALAIYIAAGRRIGRGGVKSSSRAPYPNGAPSSWGTATRKAVIDPREKERLRAERAKLREWCDERGILVHERGRIPDAVIAAYKNDDPESVGGHQPKPAKATKAAAAAKDTGKDTAKEPAPARTNGSANGSNGGRKGARSAPAAVFQPG